MCIRDRAGLAAARNNNIGVVGTAFQAEILPIRFLSNFQQVSLTGVSICNIAAEAIEYAGQFADVLVNSWGLDVACSALDSAIANVASGNLAMSKRSNGSPVLFSSGNNATGWVKVSIPVRAGEHAYEWRLLHNAEFPSPENGEVAYLDDITWPDGSTENFEGGSNLASRGFDIGNVSAGNSCIAGCVDPVLGNFFTGAGSAAWSIVNSPEPLDASSTRVAQIDASSADCSNTYLYMLRNEASAGNLDFWLWVDSNTGPLLDKFEFYIDGREQLSVGDTIFAQGADTTGVLNGTIAYPASLSGSTPGVIAVGASNSGDLSGVSSVDAMQERRAFYSQYGPNLDILAPSSDQALTITTTDQSGSAGFNNGSEGVGNDYTNSFGGTSASTPIVAGVAAAMLAVNPSLSADDVRTMLRDTADQIGTVPYDANGRNDFYGHGRVNMFRAVMSAANAAGITISGNPASAICSPEAFSFSPGQDLLSFSSNGNLNDFGFCRAIGDLPVDDGFCFRIVVANDRISVICL